MCLQSIPKTFHLPQLAEHIPPDDESTIRWISAAGNHQNARWSNLMRGNSLYLLKKNIFQIAAVLLLLIIGAGCRAADPELIDLNKLEALPTLSNYQDPPLRVAIAAVVSPQGTLESYTPLLNYLEEKLGRPVERLQGSTYAETNEILESGLAELAFVCTGAYIKGMNDFGMQILAVPEINGATVYYSWLVVPRSSPIQDIRDLEGKIFAYTDPLSLTGWMYPNYLLLQMGESPDTFFDNTFFTYSHDQAIRAVAGGFADGAAVDSLIYNYLVEREPQISTQLRIIHESPAFGMPPVVVSPEIQPALLDQLRNIFLDIAEDPEGQAALSVLGIDRFVLVDDSLYKGAQIVEVNMADGTASP